MQKDMPRAGFEPTISSLLVTRLTNLAIKAVSCFWNLVLLYHNNGELIVNLGVKLERVVNITILCIFLTLNGSFYIRIFLIDLLFGMVSLSQSGQWCGVMAFR